MSALAAAAKPLAGAAGLALCSEGCCDVSPALRCNDSMRRWKLDICAREKRWAVSACAASNAVTTASWVGSGRPVTVTVTVPSADVPAAPVPTNVKLSGPK